MKRIVVFIVVVIVCSCNQNNSAKQDAKDSTGVAIIPESNIIIHHDSVINDSNKLIIPPRTGQKKQILLDSTHSNTYNRLLLDVSEKILTAIKTKNFSQLSSYIHSKLGVRFSPYAYIDIKNGQLLSAHQLINYGKSGKRLKWGYYDGKEEIIKMNISKYFDKFVYDKDFLNAEKKSVNKFLGGGNSLNNLKKIFPDSDFTEFYFSGFEPKYGGMDWRTLRLVFKTENNKPYLIAIVHDEWTI